MLTSQTVFESRLPGGASLWNDISKCALILVIGLALSLSLLVIVPIVIGFCWLRFRLKWTSLLLLVGLAGVLVLSLAWSAGRALGKRSGRLLRCSASPDVSSFLEHTSAALILVCC